MQGFYILRPSFLHRLHPLTKLAFAALSIAAAYTLPTLFAPLAIFGALLALAIASGVARPFLRATLRILLPVAISLFVIQGLLFPPAGDAVLTIGPIALRREGFVFAFLISTRLLAFVAALVLLLQTTHPADLVFALTERGLPRSIGYIVLVSLQLIPYMQGRATAILEAQRSRGLETQGSALRRLNSIVPLTGPLIVGALSEVEERAMALELRAFMTGGPKTSLRTLRDSRPQGALRLAALLLALGLIVWRLYLAWA